MLGKKTIDYKRKRKHQQNAMMLEQLREECVIERENLGTYGAGAAFSNANEETNGRRVCQKRNFKCGSSSHQQTSHRDCPLNKKNQQAEAPSATNAD